MSDSRSSEKLVLSVREAAKRLGVCRNFAYELAARGEIPSIRLGDRVLVPLAALEKMLESATKAAIPWRAGTVRHRSQGHCRRVGQLGGVQP